MLDARTETAENVLLTVDAAGRIAAWGRRAELIFGYAAAETLGRPLVEFIVPEQSHGQQTCSPKSKPETASWYSGIGICKSGGRIFVAVFSWPIRWGNGSIESFSLIVHDVTMLRQTEMLSSGSEERYRAIFEQAAIGIVHIGFNGTILRTNARFASILGYRPEELTGRALAQITAPEHIEKSVDAFRQVLSGALASTYLEQNFLRKDSIAVWCKVTFSAQHDRYGAPIHFIGFVEDISERKAAEQRLSDVRKELCRSETRYRLIFENTIDAITITRAQDSTYLDCNPAFFTILGYNHTEAVGHTPSDLDVWATPQDRLRMIDEVLRNSFCSNFETQFRKKDGRLIWGQISASRIDLNGEPCILSITRDITAAKEARILLAGATERIRASEERYSAVFRSCSDSIFIIRLDTSAIIDANPTFFEQMGYNRSEVIGKTVVELRLWANTPTRESWLRMLRRTSTCRGFEARFRKKSGDLTWVLLSASVLEIDNTPCQIVIARDISASKVAEEEIRTLAFYDPLTGLPNRRLLIERLQQALSSGIRSGRSRALLFVDLDNFKILNDTLGHQCGDQLLCEVARRLTGAVRKSDTVARLGGDEFVVMLMDLSVNAETAGAQARIAANKILTELAKPYQINGRECLSTCSLGIALFGDRHIGAEEILQQADIAMYEAKTSGRNTFSFFAPALQAAVSARAAIEEELHQGLQNKEFTLFFQPQINHGRLMAAECLLRWNHPRRGLLPPAQFIPIAENSGLILPLGDFVLKRACTLISAWARKQETHDLAVAVNISPVQMRQPGFTCSVLTALEQAGADPTRLTLELTESMLVDNMDDIAAKMTQLKEHGIHFSLDDFGTGYSCLAYLKRLPLDQIKIDRAFVRDLLTDKTSGAIAQTIVALCRAMELTVLAEGVETAEQRDALTSLGCSCFQGFLFGHPVSRGDFERRWTRYDTPPLCA